MDWYQAINIRIKQLIPQILQHYDYSYLMSRLSRKAQGEILRYVLETNCVVIADLVVTLMFGQRYGQCLTEIEGPGVYRLTLNPPETQASSGHNCVIIWKGGDYCQILHAYIGLHRFRLDIWTIEEMFDLLAAVQSAVQAVTTRAYNTLCVVAEETAPLCEMSLEYYGPVPVVPVELPALAPGAHQPYHPLIRDLFQL